MLSKLRYSTLLLGVFLCLESGAQFPAMGQRETNPPVPVFIGDMIPSPPNQKTPWGPPGTSLPENFVTATATLFDQGLADPRECEYREIEVVSGSVWGGAGVCKLHGWVLPKATPDQAQRFGIGWNGLVYPLVSVGHLADLNEDVLKMIKTDEELRARYKIERPGFSFHRYRHAIPDAMSMSEGRLLPLKACLLLRLGHPELAEKVWTTWTAGMNPKGSNDAIHINDPYLMLASEWAWALFDRAVTGHMRGDDKLSLLSARLLASIETSVETEVERRGVLPQGLTYAVPGGRTRYLTFLEPLPELLADEQRRVKEESNPHRQTLQEDLRITDRRVRVEALVRHLDEVFVGQFGQPGGVDLRDDEIVKALIAEGDAAVEPLLEVVENDTRLTRSVSFGRDFHFARHLIGVHEAAYVALVQILGTATLATGAEWETLRRDRLEERRAIVAQIRTYLKE